MPYINAFLSNHVGRPGQFRSIRYVIWSYKNVNSRQFRQSYLQCSSLKAHNKQPPPLQQKCKQAKMKAFVTVEGRTAAVQEIPNPTPSEGEILVRVHYAAQNPTDWKAVPHRPAGRIIGCDFAGTVADANGSHWREGQRVAGFVYGTMDGPLRGAYAEYLVTGSSFVWSVPDSVTFKDASTISLAFATAVQAMFQRLGLPEPSKPATSPIPVLINGGTSSVGLYAVQLAKFAGLYVIATASKQNHDLLTALGADAVVDYKDPAWPQKVRELSHDNLQHAFDCIAEKETTATVARAMSPTSGGRVICILPRKTAELPEDISKVKVESTIVYTVFGDPLELGDSPFENWGGPTPQDRKFWEKYLGMLPEYLESGKIKPNPSRELGGLEAVAEGFALQQQGKVRAEKLVYKIA
ncbi:zinc-binding dehydrogenase [Xylaria flabelliformis]|nr:zinc-binding dehydrogenase [Xylaria flabelliformis]